MEVGRSNVFLRTKTSSGPERPLTKELFRPLARTVFYTLRSATPRIRARMPVANPPDGQSPIFIIGCGRSGTTLLGELFEKHPDISYRYEPNNLWAAVDPITDFLQLYSHGEGRCLLDASSVTPGAQLRFRRLMSAPTGLTLAEKSPVNALRIDYLESLAPDARYVHIVRDGVDVARSIEKLAKVTRKMAFRPPLNDWWGVGDAKWDILKLDGQRAGYYPEEALQLTTDAQRGAYEWLFSLREIEARCARLGSRFVEFRYQDLTEYPRETLQTTMKALGLDCPSSWLDEAAAEVSPPRGGKHGKPLVLPPEMCSDFNMLQEKFEFSGRALSTSDQPNDDLG
jgi:hypothetical protein